MKNLEEMSLAELLVYLAMQNYKITIQAHVQMDAYLCIDIRKNNGIDNKLCNTTIINPVELNHMTLSNEEVIKSHILYAVSGIEKMERKQS